MNEYLKEQFKRIGDDIKRRVDKVYSHGQFIMGPEVHELEERLADYVGMKHCVTCANGTDALRLSYKAITESNNEIWYISPFTFAASVEAISNAQFIYFQDINEKTWCNNASLSIELFGCPTNGRILGDCAQSFGSKQSGISSLVKYMVACTSFFPSKPLGCYGDGGACFTDNDETAEELRSLREHGKGKDKYDNIRVGTNSRLDTIQAAVLLAKLKIFDDELALRRQKAAIYNENLFGANVTPQKVNVQESAWAHYCVLAKDSEHRDRIRSELSALGYSTPIYYPIPLHLQPAYKYLGYEKGCFPVAENICERIFSLPFHPYIEPVDIEKVCEIIWKN